MDMWKSLDEVIIDNTIMSVHCDTRDFHCITHEEPLIIKDGRNKSITRCHHKEEYLIEESDIIEWLKSLKEISGGDGEWRMLSFDNVEDNNWLKYIRFYRVPNTTKFVVCNRDMVPILYHGCNSENLKVEQLHFCED